MINPVFKERILEERSKVFKTPFFIVIWGPGGTNTSNKREKRIKLRHFLSQEFGPENIIFPEDADPDLELWQKDWGNFAKEFYEIQAADVIIAIPETIGSLAEIALYQRDIAEKAMIFVERRPPERQGFASEAYKWLRIESVEPEEWNSCDRIRRLAREFAETRIVEKYRYLQRAK